MLSSLWDGRIVYLPWAVEYRGVVVCHSYGHAPSTPVRRLSTQPMIFISIHVAICKVHTIMMTCCSFADVYLGCWVCTGGSQQTLLQRWRQGEMFVFSPLRNYLTAHTHFHSLTDAYSLSLSPQATHCSKLRLLLQLLHPGTGRSVLRGSSCMNRDGALHLYT